MRNKCVDPHVLYSGAAPNGMTYTAVLRNIGQFAIEGESVVISDPKGSVSLAKAATEDKVKSEVIF